MMLRRWGLLLLRAQSRKARFRPIQMMRVPLSVLGLIDAALGRKEEALREGRRAMELLPVEKDTMNGGRIVVYMAMIAAWLGDNDLPAKSLAPPFVIRPVPATAN